jgi:copper chaperone CopZ
MLTDGVRASRIMRKDTPGRYTTMTTQELEYTVAGMSCGHCEAAVTEEVEQVAGVEAVEVDLETKRVVVRGAGLSDGDIRNAISEAGYEAA